jgi:multiple sugar transport system permease protein
MRGILSPLELRRPWFRLLYWSLFTILFLLSISYLFPALWMLTGALKTSLELIRFPPTLLPETPQWGNYLRAWNSLNYTLYFRNTLIIALGEWIFAIGVSATAAYGLSKLKPKFGEVWFILFIAMLMVPGEAILIPRYLTVVNVPVLNISLLNTWWAMWLLGAANAFNIFIFKRFFDQLSDDLIDAARIDGASAWQIFLRIALPLSKPVIGVVSIFTLIGSWKSFFWPLLVLTGRPDLQPIMLALYRQQHLQLNLLIAGLVIVSLPTIILFLIFQRQILQGFSFINFK